MRLSDAIAAFIEEMLDENTGTAELQRSEIASRFSCVPSQINYVIASRFTPELGYIVESRRGGGGYIKIKRARGGKNTFIMHVINAIGDRLSEQAAITVLKNLRDAGALTEAEAGLCAASLTDRSLCDLPPMARDTVRCTLLKNQLLWCYHNGAGV